MADANPKCEHCSKPMVWIGISSGASPARTCKCEDGPPCPNCGSRRTEPFTTWTYWSYGARTEEDRGVFHCIPHGHVFTPEKP